MLDHYTWNHFLTPLCEQIVSEYSLSFDQVLSRIMHSVIHSKPNVRQVNEEPEVVCSYDAKKMPEIMDMVIP